MAANIWPTDTGAFIPQVIAWPHENKPCDRKWLLENIPGAYGVLVMYFDKVRYTQQCEHKISAFALIKYDVA